MIDNESGERRSVVLEAWRRFWFAPEPAYPLGLVRIAFGALTVAWTVSLLPDLNSLFGEQGVMPNQPDGTMSGAYSVLHPAIKPC